MHDFIIAPLTRDELPAVAAIAEATEMFPGEMLGAMTAPYLDGTEPDIWLVVRSGGRLIGFAFCEPERLTNGTWNLLAISITPDRQGGGVGGALLAHLEARLRTDGCRVLLVETAGTPEFDRTRAFYRARGFTEEARIRDFYDAGIDKLVFWKAL
jgi:ribosomal protein S18 acetylase RimI-like enzyme